MKIRIAVAIGALLCATALTGCSNLSWLTVDSVPLPGHSQTNGYDIVAEFANVLNLPDRAKVVMDGTTVGEVTGVREVGTHVDVTARVHEGVAVPSNVTAVLQQATVLGDIYLALERPADLTEPSAPLAADGRIPLAQTISPPQLEDTIANMANFIGSGSIQRAQDTLVKLNRITPPKDEVRRIVTQVTTDLNALSNDLDTVDIMINSLQDTSTVARNWEPQMSFWFTPEGVRGFERSTVIAREFGNLLPSVGTIYSKGFYMVPTFSSGANAMEAIKGAKRVVEDEYPQWRRFINEFYLPNQKYPAINITSIVGPDGRELSGNVEQVLRMLGAVP
ncbi:MlaD family protein [Mycolicibacterium brumae]|uniref:MCE family protein n=1 Tax=Mycolicibacterium brumae TaxID=85968 RepID=A0A2G5PCG2_9MYCO|nr:MlaD family protein [Mycolicibacterium brumae]MCV7193106.1 MCE family protein [Mycolicibacterium brumae]PIB75997.1 MCE family protein [Mycolicibacterium brumae]UWW09762.1 MlaD family protein [Mycolicibacterium brumae]